MQLQAVQTLCTFTQGSELNRRPPMDTGGLDNMRPHSSQWGNGKNDISLGPHMVYLTA